MPGISRSIEKGSFSWKLVLCGVYPSKFVQPTQQGKSVLEQDTELVSVERQRMFTAALWLRVGAVVAIAATVELRQTLPLWMRDWILYVSFPLLLYNLAALKWRNALEHLLARHPLLLLVDLKVIGVGDNQEAFSHAHAFEWQSMEQKKAA